MKEILIQNLVQKWANGRQPKRNWNRYLRYQWDEHKNITEQFEQFIISGSFELMMDYVRDVIQERFEPAEVKILNNPKRILEYCKILGRIPSPEIHTAMVLYSYENTTKNIKEYFQTFT
jgi:hypothetical protein